MHTIYQAHNTHRPISQVMPLEYFFLFEVNDLLIQWPTEKYLPAVLELRWKFTSINSSYIGGVDAHEFESYFCIHAALHHLLRADDWIHM